VRLGVAAALTGGRVVPGDVEIDEGRIVQLGLASPNGRGYAVPGFIDLQVNGFAGVDFASADTAGYEHAGQALLETGVTSYLPTFITAPEESIAAALAEVPRESAGARILGVHLEGPFISPERLGTHPASAQRDPDRALLERLLDAGPVRLITLAPELPGALELVDLLHLRGVTVSLGHTNATAGEAEAAFARGVRTVTHLFNAMRPFAHRDPGIAGAALAHDDVIVQLIVDNVHLARVTAQVVWRTAAGRVGLVTDAMAGAGLTDGWFHLGDVEVEVRNRVARNAKGDLAGSVLTMPEAARNLHALGAPLAQAVEAATALPARILGLDDVGVLEPGARADVVVLDDNLEVERVLLGGDARVAV
jgi:N-acetylglucosamine-6-phosphate deacetylase